MKSLLIMISLAAFIVMMPVLVYAGSDQPAASQPPISQPLLREGTLATQLVDVLKVGAAANEAEAESILSRAGIAPKNGWIADYPVTPDIVGELRAAVNAAADSKTISLSKDEALTAFESVTAQFDLSVRAGEPGPEGEPSAGEYPDTTVINNYYSDEGPPVVTYYAPPPDYAYLYSWVPYPFWWTDFWFPGFFVLADFDIDVHGHHHGHEGHRRGHEDHEFVSNHFRDPGSGRMSRVDPAARSNGGAFAERVGSRWSSSAGQRGAASIFSSRINRAAGGNTGVFTPRTSGRSGSPSVSSPTGSPFGRRSAISGGPAAATFGSQRIGRSFSQPSYRQPSISSRSFSPASSGQRSFSAPSSGARSFFSGAGGRSSFGGGFSGSFGGGARGSFGGGSRGSFGGGMRR